VIVFCTTAMVTKLVAEVLSQLKLNIREIHSRKSQSARTKVSDEFRKSKGLILVSSDVSARGVDYPDVTLVVQVGDIIVSLAKRKEKKRKEKKRKEKKRMWIHQEIYLLM
jgi:superfamily II DNA or RNA helicase